MKTNIKLIIALGLVLIGIMMYNQHHDKVRAEYARTHNCEWSVYASHDICK